jgi:hypothetical protein
VSNSLDVLAEPEVRDALLLAEVGGWLHMFGKLHECFLNGYHSLDLEIPSDVPNNLFEFLSDATWTANIWNDLLKELPSSIPNSDSKDISIYSLIQKHRSKIGSVKQFLIRLIIDVHGRGSSIEKGISDNFTPDQKRGVYLSTALGYEYDTYIDLDVIRNNRKDLYKFLYTQLGNLKARNVKLTESEWVGFQQKFTRRIEKSFSQTVAETRRPFNDVTLLDQTAISVAFFKAALAQNLLREWKDPDQKEVAKKYHWCLLRIGLDGG